ncbi:GNAT family N-acetyltransferase [Jonesia quinghaiensis]|uniref:GNAT family N-acetyltransferase n=1 Tax=Jonesia quinghaiensis TaxID=262806 RepID=UPI000421D721|nr:GNAT family N-acetyltransferase [Jonesia quinghaiensis]
MSSSEDTFHQAYPQHWEADVVLRDGTTAHLRPIIPTDREALQQFHTAQSQQSTYMRFFAYLERLSDRDLTLFTEVDYTDRVAIIATITDSTAPTTERIIGVARFDRIEADEAEVAFNISDQLQGKGLGSVLLEHIADAAREVGIRRFTAEVLPQNSKMLSVFTEAGYQSNHYVDDGIVTVSVNLDPTARSLQVMAEREYRAEARSMARLYAPQRIVLVASLTDEATPEETRLATAAIRSQCGVTGQQLHIVGLTPVTIRDAQQRHGLGDNFVHHHNLDAFRRDTTTFDLAMIAVADHATTPLLGVLAAKGIHTAVLLSSGFAEGGEHGLTLQREMLRTAHATGIRIVGPASYGLFSHTATPPFNASLAPTLPRPGSIGLFCQSGAMAVTLLTTITRRDLGISTFLSAGNRADISGNDLMQYWHDDTTSTAVGMYLESIGNPRKYARIARRLSRKKPVVAVIAGQSGHIVPRGHAVRTTQTPRKALDHMFQQSGVIRTANTHEMVDTLQYFATQPLPGGHNIAILASSEALAAITAEAAWSAGITITHTRIITHNTPTADVQNTVAAIYAAPDVDIVVFAHVPTTADLSHTTLAAIAAAAASSHKPTVASVFGLHGLTSALTSAEHTIPAYSTPEDAIKVLRNVLDYATWVTEDHGTHVDFDGIDRHRAAHLIAGAPHGPATPELTRDILAAYGIDLWDSITVHDAESAIAAAHTLGWPVALKSTVEALRHRADLGGVRLNISTPEELATDFADMSIDLSRHLGTTHEALTAGFTVQRMAPSGVACVLRTSEDDLFGPVVSFGLSGDATDLLDDLSYGIAPLTTRDTHTMVTSIAAAPRLFGYKGLPTADTNAIEELLGRLSLLADHHPQISALELYPVVVAHHGAAVLSARIDIQPARRHDGLRRQLPH